MIHVINTAIELGYLTVPKGMIIDIEEMNRYPDEKIVLITTGSQGEPMSALTRMAMNGHKKVTITPTTLSSSRQSRFRATKSLSPVWSMS